MALVAVASASFWPRAFARLGLTIQIAVGALVGTACGFLAAITLMWLSAGRAEFGNDFGYLRASLYAGAICGAICSFYLSRQVKAATMNRTILNTYAALVCLASLAFLAIGVGVIIYSSIGFVNPSITLSPYAYPLVESNDAYWFRERRPLPGPDLQYPPRPTDEEITRRREAQREVALNNERDLSRQALIRWCIISVIAAIIFFTHWPVLRRSQPHAA